MYERIGGCFLWLFYIYVCTDTKDDEEETVEDTKEMACMPGYEMLSEREKKVSACLLAVQ